MIRRRSGNETEFGARAGIRLFAVLAVALFTIIASTLTVLAPVENAMLLVFSPARSALSAVVRPVDDFFDHFGQFGQLQSENELLRAENERLSVEIARKRENEAALNDLSKLFDVKASRSNDRFLEASIVARSSGRYQEAIAVNRGASDGIVVDMVVLAPGGSMMGRVTSVTSDFAWVTLITDPTSKIPGLVQDGRFDGILVGRSDGEMRLEMLPQGSTVRPGEIVVTSGLDGELPRGLPLGKVVEVGGSDQDLFPAVFVEPLASLRNIENVLVLTSFRPGGVPRYPGSGPAAGRSSAPAETVPRPQGESLTESALPRGGR